GLEVYNPVGANGVFLPDTGLFAGQHVFKANDAIIAELQARGMLLHHAPFEHSYPHCWRHKSPVIFRATTQWFIAMDGADRGSASVKRDSLRSEALQEIAKVRWLPAWG